MKSNLQQEHFTYLQLVWRQYKKNHLAFYSIYVIIVLFAIAVLAPLIANDRPYILKYNNKLYFPIIKNYPELNGKNYKELADRENVQAVFPPVPYSPTEYDLSNTLMPPNSRHWLGTDDRGRDVLCRLIYGTRISLSVGFVAISITLIIGIIIGSSAGYYGGWIDLTLSRLIELFECFPTLIVILAILAFLSPSIYNIMIVIGLLSWPGIARLIRGEYLKLKNQEFVLAARALGLSHQRIIYNHILPNALAPVLVSITFGVASAILLEAVLSFLGFGTPPPTASWGEILNQASQYVDFAWWLIIFPGLAIFITIVAFNLIGEGIRDAIDPRLR